jgi:hypothetical protein
LEAAVQNFQDAIHASSMRSWSLTGPMRLVKVVGPAAEDYMLKTGLISGYFTQEKYLYGMSPAQIERALGLRPMELSQLARIYAFARLPTTSEVDFRLSAALPDGKPFEQQQMDALLAARLNYASGSNLYARSQVPTVQAYPPGSAMVPQWTFHKGMGVPIGGLIASVTPVFPFPRESGSIKPYTPHNRGPIR